MKKEKVIIKYGEKEIKIEVGLCRGLHQLRGMMFRKRLTARAILFNFRRKSRPAIHSYFVSFPFIAVWLNAKNKVIDHGIVEPKRLWIVPDKPCYSLLEIPINKYYRERGLIEWFL